MALPRRRSTLLALFLLTTLAVTACGIDEDALGAGGGTKIESELPTQTTQPPESTIPPLDADDLRNVAAEVQDYWTDTMPEVYGEEYEVIPDERIIAGTPDATYPTCGGDQIGYSDVEGNAFAAPCEPEGITVVWDDANLIPTLSENFGSVAPAIVLAHEWGHVAQFELGIDVATVIMEQQADCFAGAWLGALLEDPGPLTELADANPLDASLQTIVEVRDQPGVSIDDPSAHGTGFDRVRSLQEGFEQGAEHCSTYIDNPPSLIDLQFSEADIETGGNLPLDELIPLVVEDLNDFYGEEVPGFEGSSENAVESSSDAMDQLEDLHDRVGDNGAGVVLALVWARFAQQQTGSLEGRDEFGQLLQQACLTGGWFLDVLERTTGEQAPEDQGIIFSPGDIDEAVIALIDLGTPEDTGESTGGGLFELVAAMRQGITDGFDSCGLGE
jgi:predicted metalloprotease